MPGGVLHGAPVDVGIEDAKGVEAVDHAIHVLARHREDRLDHPRAQLLLDPHDHAEVEQHQPALAVSIRRLPGVRVGVHEAVLEHHLEIHLDQRAHERVETQVAGGQPLVQPVHAGPST